MSDNAPDRIWTRDLDGTGSQHPCWPGDDGATEYMRADGPTITAYREALRLLGVNPDSIAREAEKEAQ